MTFRVSNGSRPPYFAMHDVMVGLRLPTTLFRWRGSLYILFRVVLRVRTYVDRGNRDVWIGVSGVWSYGGCVDGGIAKHVAMSNW